MIIRSIFMCHVSKMNGELIRNFLFNCRRTANSMNGPALAELFTIWPESSIQFDLNSTPSNEIVRQINLLKTDEPTDEIAANFLKALVNLQDDDVLHAFECLASCLQLFMKQMQTHKDNWALPAMVKLVVATRILAFKCEEYADVEVLDKVFEKGAETLMNCFRICCNDTRSDIKVTKRWGMLHIVNQLFKIYFKMNNLKLFKPLIIAIEGSNIKNDYVKAQLVTYKYFLGRIQLIENNFGNAEECLSYAFYNCDPGCFKNMRQILSYLVPLKLLLGYIPQQELLEKYELDDLSIISSAVCQGDLRILRLAIDENEQKFLTMGLMPVLEKLTTLTHRNLFKRIYLMHNSQHQLNLNMFLEALKHLECEDIDYDETECIVAGLIAKGYIKGYISHQHNVLVVSKQNPFPSLKFLRS